MAYWIDDGFDSWPEVAQAGTAAAGLYIRCGAWIARNMANGRITDAIVPAEIAGMHGTVEWRQRLVDAGLWATEGSGFRDLRYFDLNPTPDQIADRRNKRAAAGRKGGLARGKKQKPSNGQANASTLLQPPSLPPPSTKGEGGVRPRSAHGAAHAPEDPRVIAEAEEELRLKAEAAVTAIAEHQQRTARGAAAARAAIPKRIRPDPGPSALERLREATADLPPLSHPPPDEPEPLAEVIALRPGPVVAGPDHQHTHEGRS